MTELPEPLQHYQVQKVLQVREGHTTLLAQSAEGQAVIIKTFRMAEYGNWEELNLFEREARTLKNLRHPRIPGLIEIYREDNALAIHLVQTAVPGQSMREHLAQTGIITETLARQWAHDMLHILEHIHSLHPPVIHRDIKPDNILIDEDGHLHLIDFGAVREGTLNNNLTVAGTFGYMPPEQAAGQAVPATDLYALSMTLIEALSGKSPHAFRRNSELRVLFQEEVQVSAGFIRWLHVMTDPDMEQRPANAREALHWLDADALPQTAGRVTAEYPASGVVKVRISLANLLAERHFHRVFYRVFATRTAFVSGAGRMAPVERERGSHTQSHPACGIHAGWRTAQVWWATLFSQRSDPGGVRQLLPADAAACHRNDAGVWQRETLSVRGPERGRIAVV